MTMRPFADRIMPVLSSKDPLIITMAVAELHRGAQHSPLSFSLGAFASNKLASRALRLTSPTAFLLIVEIATD